MTSGFSCVTASSVFFLTLTGEKVDTFHTTNSDIHYILSETAERHQNKENQAHVVCRVPSKASEPPTPFIFKHLGAYFEISFSGCFHWHCANKGREMGRVRRIQIHRKKKTVTLITQHISGKFYTCFPLFFRKVEFQISLSALSRLLDSSRREAFDQGMGMCCIQFLYSSMHIMSDTCDRMATICCWETSSVAHQHGSKGAVWLWNGEVSTSPHIHKCAHTHQALRASVMTVPIAGFCGASQPVCAMRVTQLFKGWNTCAYMTLTWR